jgi:hypothetical protein
MKTRVRDKEMQILSAPADCEGRIAQTHFISEEIGRPLDLREGFRRQLALLLRNPEDFPDAQRRFSGVSGESAEPSRHAGLL